MALRWSYGHDGICKGSERGRVRVMVRVRIKVRVTGWVMVMVMVRVRVKVMVKVMVRVMVRRQLMKTNYDEMKAGEQLDRLIAEKVMGLEMDGHLVKLRSCESRIPKAYSTSIAHAWEVVEKLIELGFYPDLISDYRDVSGMFWRCELHTANDEDYPDNPYIATGKTAERAVCLAALKAMDKIGGEG